MTALAVIPPGPKLPALVAAAGDEAGLRFLEFFAAAIRNVNTRRAYRRAAEECDEFAPPHARPLDPMASKEYGSNTPRQVGRIAAVPPNPAVWP